MDRRKILKLLGGFTSKYFNFDISNYFIPKDLDYDVMERLIGAHSAAFLDNVFGVRDGGGVIKEFDREKGVLSRLDGMDEQEQAEYLSELISGYDGDISKLRCGKVLSYKRGKLEIEYDYGEGEGKGLITLTQKKLDLYNQAEPYGGNLETLDQVHGMMTDSNHEPFYNILESERNTAELAKKIGLERGVLDEWGDIIRKNKIDSLNHDGADMSGLNQDSGYIDGLMTTRSVEQVGAGKGVDITNPLQR